MSEVQPAPLWGGTSYPFGIAFHPGLARALEHAGYGSAITKAIILSRIHDLLPTSPFIRDGVPWVGNSHEHWRADHFPFLSVAGVKTLFKKLEQDGLLIAKKRGRTNPVAYRPDYDKLAKLQANEPPKLEANEQTKLILGGHKPPTSATTEQDAPQTTLTPAEPEQDATAAHVEGKLPGLRVIDPDEFVEDTPPSLPSRTMPPPQNPNVKALNAHFQELGINLTAEKLFNYWEAERQKGSHPLALWLELVREIREVCETKLGRGYQASEEIERAVLRVCEGAPEQARDDWAREVWSYI